MQFVIDFTPIIEFSNLPLPLMLWRLFINIGWIPLGVVFLWGAKELWLQYIRGKWEENNANFTLLAIDIPRNNEQSPKAMENMLTYLAGAHGSVNLIEKYWEGKFQLQLSLEIISIEGYTQFIIYTPVEFRNLVESAIYSQYPDAEITEIEDYTKGFPTKFPDDEYDIWGSEFVQVKNKMYPIRTYVDFYHSDAGPYEPKFKDPIASLMDLNSSMGKGEHLWHQIVITPIGYDWMDKGDKEVSKILKEKVGPEKTIVDKMTDPILGFFDGIANALASVFGFTFSSSEPESEDDAFKMFQLKPKEKRQIDSIQHKISKTAFDTKIRMVYMAKKSVINKSKAVNGFVGYIKQFTDLDLNNLKPDVGMTATTTAYFFKDSRLNTRKNKIINAYIGRSDSKGRAPGLLNVEELATLWHFPIEASVKAPRIQKAPATKAQPPMGLPETEEEDNRGSAVEILSSESPGRQDTVPESAPFQGPSAEEKGGKKGAPPDDLPVE
jgi:hypothetical protein